MISVQEGFFTPDTQSTSPTIEVALLIATYRFQIISKDDGDPFLPTKPLSMSRVVMKSICQLDNKLSSPEADGMGVEM